MADFADQASEANDAYLADALARRARARMQVQAGSAIECEECGDEIPEARRKAVPGCTRCTWCQTIFDKARGLNA